MSLPTGAPQGARHTFAADLATAPNIVTLSRIVLVLAAAAMFFLGLERPGIVVAVVGGMTDYLDGWLARKTGQVTRLGEVLDQFCDVFFESLVLYLAIARFQFLPPWVLIVYLGREFWVTTIRRFMAGVQMNIPSSFLGKLKTNFVMWGFLPAYLSIERVFPAAEPGLRYVGQGAIATGILLGYLSAWDYTRQLIAGYDQLSAPPPSVEPGSPERVARF
jgi:CDP-diacylglycerol--glycerol-3-phosphate 3-phosphatidyltransferase